jgi:hypothetical protein
VILAWKFPVPDGLASTLAGIRAAEQAATPGEWKHRTATSRGDWTTGSKVMPIERVEADARPHGIGIFDSSADAEFIVTARTVMPLLLDAVEAVLKLADEWESDSFIVDPEIALREVITRALTGKEAGE